MTPESRSQAIAAAVILLCVGLVIYFLPTLVLWIGNYSPVLGFVVGAALLLCFFLIFWLRARFQRRK
ncbi:hypothetical protein EDE05_13231 [Neorhizobium sp. R1-B]|jgi:hypothetical protein|uniref:hypothetical protein n=1 Tax=Neorhizobium TaxID=1525371 RepID=UPI000CF9711C|nr:MULTISPECIES: hypothetical protein [Neorhizobium]TCV59075.1 hypothetical protein EDE09_13411 [Neorhizobium sp. S3-V5DH]TDX70969.1 hypothetical protein EDE05_13231 [Neorhizobium sp. R1-B]